MSMLTEALICLGANSADKIRAVEAAYTRVAALGTVVADSGPYPTPAEGTPPNTESYNNRLLRLLTPLPLNRLHTACKEYEAGVRSAHSGDGVAIDIDIVTFGADVLRPVDFASAYFTTGLAKMEAPTRP